MGAILDPTSCQIYLNWLLIKLAYQSVSPTHSLRKLISGKVRERLNTLVQLGGRVSSAFLLQLQTQLKAVDMTTTGHNTLHYNKCIHPQYTHEHGHKMCFLCIIVNSWSKMWIHVTSYLWTSLGPKYSS